MTPYRTPTTIALVLLPLITPSPPHACNLPSELSRVVAKVESADTLILDDGSEVVLIGTMPPVPTETDGPDQPAWPPAEATRKHLEALVGGKAVDLAFAGRRHDRYGRQLAHVFVNQTTSRHWVQGDLITHGLARAYTLPGNTACIEDLLDQENLARANLAGHWGTGVFQDRSAHDPRELTRYRDTFQTIEGRIHHTTKVRGQQVVDFTASDRTGFSVWISPTSSTPRTASSIAPGSLTGKRVRVRGWVEQHRGPRVTLDNLRQIEILQDLPEDLPQTTTPAPDNAATITPAPIPATRQ
ncbi:MAG: thermonuclease family protein [Hyphomicrobiaceae bacterium]